MKGYAHPSISYLEHQYLQCISIGDTVVLHKDINTYLHDSYTFQKSIYSEHINSDRQNES